VLPSTFVQIAAARHETSRSIDELRVRIGVIDQFVTTLYDGTMVVGELLHPATDSGKTRDHAM
jgi:hypothetical protein